MRKMNYSSDLFTIFRDSATTSRSYSRGKLYAELEYHVIRSATFVGWLVGFGFNGPLRQYFSLYQAVSQREGEKGKKR